MWNKCDKKCEKSVKKKGASRNMGNEPKKIFSRLQTPRSQKREDLSLLQAHTMWFGVFCCQCLVLFFYIVFVFFVCFFTLFFGCICFCFTFFFAVAFFVAFFSHFFLGRICFFFAFFIIFEISSRSLQKIHKSIVFVCLQNIWDIINLNQNSSKTFYIIIVNQQVRTLGHTFPNLQQKPFPSDIQPLGTKEYQGAPGLPKPKWFARHG